MQRSESTHSFNFSTVLFSIHHSNKRKDQGDNSSQTDEKSSNTAFR
jgi:hypothetical protein